MVIPNKTDSVEKLSSKRIISKISGEKKGPTIVFFSGIHGNEKAGVVALKETLSRIDAKDIQGTVYGILGNLKAIEHCQRYIKTDLNRLWTTENLKILKSKEKLNSEEQEQKELLYFLKHILSNNKEPIYFIDLHTTSSKTLPFITINDALINRKFSNQFPVPIVLGIEEYLEGPLLSYINELGYVSLGFESGQHEDAEAIENAKAFVNLALVYSGVIKKERIAFSDCFNQLKKAANNISSVFEIVHLHRVTSKDSFKMINGFSSFQKINKGTEIATYNNEIIISDYKAKIFMPLYQKMGSEGFFLIRKIAPFVLNISATIRKLKLDKLLVLLPGISWESKEKHVLKVNLKTTKFMAKQVFHLFGYRSQQEGEAHLKLYSRERKAKVSMYDNTGWYKKRALFK